MLVGYVECVLTGVERLTGIECVTTVFNFMLKSVECLLTGVECMLTGVEWVLTGVERWTGVDCLQVLTADRCELF